MSQDYLSELTFLSKLHQRSRLAKDLETVLTDSLTVIHAQIQVTKTLGIAWQHHIDTYPHQEARAGEQVLLINRFLRTGSVTREIMWSWTQRLLFIDSLYQIKVDSGQIPACKRKEWLENGTDHSTYAQDKLDQYVAAIEAQLAKAEKRLNDEKCGEQLPKETAAEEQAMKMEVERMEDSPAENLPAATDDEYLDRFVEENKEMEEDEDCSVEQIEHGDHPSDEDAPGPSHRHKSENWERDVQQLKFSLDLLPRRKLNKVPSSGRPNQRQQTIDARLTQLEGTLHTMICFVLHAERYPAAPEPRNDAN
ncbi:hypothetical protein COOONC_09853 [Cooperia oncophora]